MAMSKGEQEARDQVRTDFDRIADLPEPAWNHNSHYHRYLLAQLPDRMEHALEIGSGNGELAHLLAKRSRRVTAIDFSEGMITKARAAPADDSTIEWIHADIMEWEASECQFDAIVSVATLHHLSLEVLLPRMARWLRPGGVLALLDLTRDGSLFDSARSALAFPVNVLMMKLRNGRFRPSRESREIWNAHGKHDRYLTCAEAREIYGRLLPGSIVRRHFYWRYSAVWRKG